MTLAHATTSTGNAAWLSRSRNAVWHPCTQMKQHERLPLVQCAAGIGMYDAEYLRRARFATVTRCT